MKHIKSIESISKIERAAGKLKSKERAMEKYLEKREKISETKIDTDHDLQNKSVDLNEHLLHVENLRGLSKQMK